MRILGLDVGDRYIGIAVSDALGITAQGIGRIDRDKWQEKLPKLIEEYNIESVVIGLPRMMNGSIGIQGEKVKRFASELRKYVHLPITLWDERLSTVSAERMLIEADISRKRRRSLRDKVSAVIILQNYLDSRRS